MLSGRQKGGLIGIMFVKEWRGNERVVAEETYAVAPGRLVIKGERGRVTHPARVLKRLSHEGENPMHGSILASA